MAIRLRKPAAVWRQLHRVAARLDDDLGDEVGMIGGPQRAMSHPDDWPPPPMTVGLDGGYVHAREGSNRKAGWFEVMVGKSIPDTGVSKCFAMVHTLDAKPRRRLDAVLGAQGLAQRHAIRFVTDGGDTVRNLQQHLHGEGERISSGFTESAVNQELSRRMVKKQQMRWTKRGAHLLLQTRTQTLNGDLRKCFQRWHPDMKAAA